MPERTDHNEALRLAQALKNRQEVEDDAADMLMQQAERIAELEKRAEEEDARITRICGLLGASLEERYLLSAKLARLQKDRDQNTIKREEGVVLVCPTKDSVCGDRPANWCETCPNQNRIKNDHARTTHKETE